MARIKNLPELGLNRAQDFVLIETRTDRLTDLGQQFIFLRAPVRVMADDVVFEREPELQRQANHQMRA